MPLAATDATAQAHGISALLASFVVAFVDLRVVVGLFIGGLIIVPPSGVIFAIVVPAGLIIRPPFFISMIIVPWFVVLVLVVGP